MPARQGVRVFLFLADFRQFLRECAKNKRKSARKIYDCIHFRAKISDKVSRAHPEEQSPAATACRAAQSVSNGLLV